MNLVEAIKKSFMTSPAEVLDTEYSNKTSEPRVVRTLSDNDYEGALVFSNLTGEEWAYSGEDDQPLIIYQNRIIDMYRNLAKNPDVNNIIDMIVNEMVFTVEDEEFKITIDEENNTIKSKIGDIFSKVLTLLNTTDNIHTICRQAYIDGQINVSLGYNKSIKDGIQKAEIIEARNLYFDKNAKTWKYNNRGTEESLYSDVDLSDYDEEYSSEEMVHVDFGLFSKVNVGTASRGQVNLGYLENAFKAANQLNTLENMLVPLRYSRSVSRRLFNIDVADLPPKQAKELMDKIRAEFRYKKSYDTENGTIKNQAATQPLVEDYWMSNRNGSRGTTVDTMDEKGGLMDMEDIIYASKKLYSSLKVPTSRNPYAEENGGDFSFDSQDTTNEDLQYFLHVDRLRIPIVKLFKEILKREIISTGVMSEKEWVKYDSKIKIEFTSKSVFLENMEKDLLMKSMGNWEDIKTNVGVIISFEEGIKKTFGWSNEQLQTEMEKITTETNNPLYKSFYASREDGF